MALSTTALIVGGLAAAGSIGASVYNTQRQVSAQRESQEQARNLQAQALAEQKASVKKAESQAQESMRQQARSRYGSRSIYTSPLGIQGEANVARKTLLGQ